MGGPVFFGRRSADPARNTAGREFAVCNAGFCFGANFDWDCSGLCHAGGD